MAEVEEAKKELAQVKEEIALLGSQKWKGWEAQALPLLIQELQLATIYVYNKETGVWHLERSKVQGGASSLWAFAQWVETRCGWSYGQALKTAVTRGTDPPGEDVCTQGRGKGEGGMVLQVKCRKCFGDQKDVEEGGSEEEEDPDEMGDWTDSEG